jgi:hypothetical protein
LIDHVGERNLLTKIEVRRDALRSRIAFLFSAAARTKLCLGAFWACQALVGGWI